MSEGSGNGKVMSDHKDIADLQLPIANRHLCKSRVVFQIGNRQSKIGNTFKITHESD
jgi:hypothetical protein